MYDTEARQFLEEHEPYAPSEWADAKEYLAEQFELEEAHLELPRLFHCAYEYDNGLITLNYPSGIELQNDVHTRGCQVTGPVHKRNLLFEGDLEEAGRDWLDYSFAGNASGQVILNCRFKNGVQIEFDVVYQMIIADNPHFQVLFNSDQRGENFYATDWGTWLMDADHQRGTNRSHTKNTAIPEQPPHLCMSKREPHHFKIRYNKKGGDEDARLRVWLDDALTFDIKTANKYTEGFVGFRWHNVKFVVTNLSVKGHLDIDWARETLAKVGDDDF